MYFQKRGEKFSFLYHDRVLGRNVRLSQKLTPHMANESEAEAFCKKFEAENDAQRYRIEKRLSWREKYYNFEELIEKFRKAKNLEAPNVVDDMISHLRLYLFPFFLALKNQNNINLWEYHFEELRDYLRETKPAKGNKPRLALSTVNNIINTLNQFFEVSARYHLAEKAFHCRQFEKALLNRRGAEHVMSEEIAGLFVKCLKKRNMRSSDLFLVLLNTGLRVNEAMGLSLSDFHLDIHKSDYIKKLLMPFELMPLAYISVDSQPKNRINPRNARGVVERKALKSKKTIDPRHARNIPILDKETFNVLAARFNEQRKLFKVGRWGQDLKNYLLFDGLTNMVFANDMTFVRNKLKTEVDYSPHSLRHTYATRLVEKVSGNFTLCNMILGHHDINMTMRYVHINEAMKLKSDTVDLLENEIKLIA